MATVIKFVGGDGLVVDEDPEIVREALTDSDGEPMGLTLAKQGEPVYANPANIAYWHPPLGSGAAQFH